MTNHELEKMARALDAFARLDEDTRRDIVRDFERLDRFDRAIEELIEAAREMQALLRDRHEA